MPPPDERDPADSAALRRLRVLCAEDHEQVANLICLILERAGHHAECAADGAQALERVASSSAPYDLVITDHVMPVLDGLGLVRELRRANFAGGIIVQSARLSPSDRASYVELGVKHFIEKPVRPETLRKLLVEFRQS